MLTIITPTRNRPHCFSLLEGYIGNQTYTGPLQWIVVNDGEEAYTYTRGQEVLIRKPSPCPFPNSDLTPEGKVIHSLCANLLHALPHVQGDKVLFCEDDDVYFPRYLQTMHDWLDEADLVGSAPARYYNLFYHEWREMPNTEHCSLAQTGITRAALPLFREIAERGDPFIDLGIWEAWTGSRRIYPNENLYVGMKGLWGEAGIGLGHQARMGRPDHFGILDRWLGPYAENYR